MSVRLSEINAYNPQGDLAKGTTGVVYDISSGLQAAQEAARQRSANILQRYSMFQKNLSDYAQNHQLDFAGVLKEDIPKLRDQAIKYFDKVRSNPSMITQIGEDPDWTTLQSSIAKSKADNGYLALQDQFRQSHPDLYNPDNDKIATDFRNTPLESRSTFTWKLPAYMDAQKLATTALGSIGEKFDTNVKSDQPGYFLETKGIKYDPDKFNQVWSDLLGSNAKIDDYGHTIQQAAQSNFDKLPKQIQDQFAKINPDNPLAAYWQKLGQSYYKDKDITDTQLVEDKYGEQEKELALAKQRLGLDWAKFNKDNQDDAIGADSVINQATSILNKGVPYVISNYNGKVGQDKNVLKIADPTLLNTFGKIDKDGTVTNVPDEVFFDKDNGQLKLTYYKKDPEQPDGIAKDSKGRKKIEDTKDLDERTWLNEITKRSFPNKDIGGVNSIIDQVLNKSGNSLYNVALGYKKEVPTETKTTIDLSKLTPVQKGGKTYYVDSVKRIVYDSEGNVIK